MARRPWIEALPLIASSGHANPQPKEPAPMKADFDYCWFQTPERLEQPRAFTTLGALARHIQAQRADRDIQLEERQVYYRAEAQPRRVVAVLLLGQDGSPGGFLGHAWLSGRGRHALEAALYAVVPNPAARTEAAA